MTVPPPNQRVSRGSRLRGSIAVLASVLLSACGALPTQVDRPFSPAQPPSADSPLVRIAQDSSPAPTLTGFRLLPDGFYSLDARIQLARRARDSLDVQYYLIQDDRTGRLLMRNLRDAALRGVRVRLLVDDLYTAGGDPMFRGLAAFPNVEVRLFNPFCCARQSIVGKYVASLADFRRLNHRMHNKLFIADGAVAVMGGRNIADEYFTRSATSNFVDMDVFVVGPVVRQLASIFDVYWNSPQAYPVEAIIGESADRDEAQRSFDHLVDDGEQMRSIALPPFDILGYRPDKRRPRFRTSRARLGHRDRVCRSARQGHGDVGRNGAIDERADERHGSSHGIEERGRHFVPVLHSGDDGRAGIRRLEKTQCQGHHPHQFTRGERRAPGSYGIRALPRGIAANRRRPL